MDNWLKHQKEQKKSEIQGNISSQQQKIDRNRHFKNINFSLQAKTRIESWVNDNDAANNMLEPLKKGSIPLMHMEHYKHRSRNKLLERDPKGILLKSYYCAKDRANLQETRNKEFIMDRDEYNPNLPFKSEYLRERDPAKEFNYSMRFGLHPRLENTRIVEEIHKKSYIDHHEKNMKMINNPDWKESNKNKWLGDQFLTTNCNFTGKKNKNLGTQIPLNLNDTREKYIDGYETMGDLSRKRKKSKEFHRPEFIPVISKDQWNTTIQASNSWRTNKCDSIFQAKSDFDEFSKNKKNIEYKTTLINTKSVDHQMPFAHSNNLRGKTLKDFRPNYDKIYNQSIKEYLAENKFETETPKLIKQKSELSTRVWERGEKKMNQSIQNNSIIEEKDSPRGPSISPNNSALRLRKKKELMFINKEDKIKAAITKCFGGLD